MDPHRRAARQDRKRQAILDAARALVAREGLPAITVAGVAQELELTPGALYRYFPSKEQLLHAVEREAVEDLTRLFDAALEHLQAAPPLDALVALLDLYVALALRGSTTFAVLARFIDDPGPVLPNELARDVAVPALALFGRLAHLFDRAAAEGALAPGPGLERTLITWSALHGMLTRQKLARLGHGDVEALAWATVDALLMGFGAAAGSSGRRIALRPLTHPLLSEVP